MKLALGLAPGSYDSTSLGMLIERLRGMVASRDARMGEEGAGKAALIARQEAEIARLLEENTSKDKQVNGLKEENASKDKQRHDPQLRIGPSMPIILQMCAPKHATFV